MSKKTARIALVTLGPLDEFSIGGLATMTAFLQYVVGEFSPHDCEVISLANSMSDSASVRFLQPWQWLGHPDIVAGRWHGKPYWHVGAYWVELEPKRYQARAGLTELLERFDLVQFVVGYPAWACSARGVSRPILIWTATTSGPDRYSRMRQMASTKRIWTILMLRLAESYDRAAIRLARFVFALSTYTLDQIKPWTLPERIAPAPCGVDTNLFLPDEGENGKYILAVGRLSDARKNIGLLFRAYSRLLKCLPCAPELYLVGDLYPTQQVCHLLAKLRILDKVRFIGPKRGHELAELYRGASTFVLSSDEEGLGIVILEAMASGLPVISTACGGPETLVLHGETGFLTPVGDADTLANAIHLTLTDTVLRNKMRRNARLVAEERFSYHAASKVFLDKYKQILGSI
jgi:glycosyltransferase involved in cell wall biosynthesis